MIRPAKTADHTAIKNILTELDMAYPGQSFDDFFVLEEAHEIKAVAKWQDVTGYYFLSSLGVPPPLQSKGYASQLLSCLLNLADKDTYLYTVIPQYFKRFGFAPEILKQPLPIKKTFDCKDCFPNKCVCMKRPMKKIEASDIHNIKKGLLTYHPDICELNVSNLIIWQDFDRPHITCINGKLCILIKPINEAPFFLAPPADTIDICLNQTRKISRVPEKTIETLPQGKYYIKCLRDHADYIYETSSLASLSGRKFDGKRNHINNFKKHHPGYKLIDLKQEHEKQALPVFEEWFKARQETQYFQKLAYSAQRTALKQAFTYFNEIELIGLAIEIDKQIKGFVLGSQLSPNTISLHFQYAFPQVQGIFPVLLNEFCKSVKDQFQFINLEQDLGIAGLRKSKLSYYPARIIKKFEITL